MFTLVFWVDVAERAAKTFAQALAAALIASGTGLLNAPWWAALSAAGMAAVLSLLTSVASSQVGDPATASLSKNVTALR